MQTHTVSGRGGERRQCIRTEKTTWKASEIRRDSAGGGLHFVTLINLFGAIMFND